MGLETVCTVLFDQEAYEPRVLLETDALVFRGALKKTIPFREMSGVRAEEESLTFLYRGARIEARVGPKAAVWADKILHPKSLIDKLGVKADEEVSLIAVTDGTFREKLGEKTSQILEGIPETPVPWILFQVDTAGDLERLPELRQRITENGAIWIIHPKGRQDLKDLDVFAAAKSAGLVDVKVAAFSPAYSAIKLVIPRAQRR